METQIATDVAQLAHEMGSDSHILRIDPSRSASSRSAVSRAVTRARSESDAHLLPPNPTPATPDLDPLPSVSISLPTAARESEALSDLAGPSQLDSEHSVFDDIEPISLHRKYTTPAPAPTQTAVTSNSTRAWRGPSRSVSTSSSIFEDDDEEREDKSGLVPEVKPSPANAPATDQANRSAALAEELFARARFADAAGPSANLAAMILNGQEEERVDLIPDLILHLIHEGRPGIAYHLSRCLESRNACLRPFVPSWLIRTWTFGQALVFPKGQLAGLLQDDLASRPTSDTQDSSRDWKLALSLLIRASTLRPSIIAPATRAASVLRNFDLQDSCVQLYNYCSRVGVYGERIQGVFPGLFKQSIAATPYADQLSKLRSDIKRWREAADTIRLKVQLASPLFQKTGWSLRAGTGQRFPDAAFDWRNWQMALSMAESLLEPVLQDRSGELSRVKADIEEISTQLSSTESPDGRRLFSQPEVRAYLRQVTTFAQRWLSLRSGSAKNEAQNYLPQAAVELRSEIQNRHEPVMEELQALASEHTSFEVRMAVACLMLSVNDVRGLVVPDTASESSEADPRHLLHSELLKISGLRLAATWEPAVDMHLLEDEILGFLCQPQPDWTTAYQMHLAQGNHPLAERIVSLAIWNNEEREALQGVLERDRRRQRTNFVRELHDVNQLLAESALLEILNESERKGFETRLARLQKIATAESDLSTGVTELDKVREALVKRRERETERMRVRLRQLSEPSSGSSVIETTTSQDHSEPSQQGWVMDFDR